MERSRSSYCIQNSDDGWDINRTPPWNNDFRHHHSCGKYNTIEHEGNNMSYDLSYKEEVVHHV
ncbi:hypothetical protein HanRHA438_Chr14g0637431 [Helianthus annuus]|nr:hypothetical protein HanRHA438_Chr14g0637431 [Helianthus annuus]